MTRTPALRDAPLSPALRIAMILGLLWNLFGVHQYIGAATATSEGLIAAGLTPEQAAVMTGYPAWMTAAFAIGVFGGTLGTVLLLIRRRAALPVLSVSLAAYVILFVGDITEGVFAIMGMPQMVILTIVVLIAAGLLWLARHLDRRAALR